MQNSRKTTSPLAYEVDGYTYNISDPVALNTPQTGPKHTGPNVGVELQASQMCPKNFIFFDQSDNKDRIMFNPALVNKLNWPTFDIHATCVENCVIHGNSKSSSSLEEDSKDIDALLSLEEEDDEDEVVSTGRTEGNYGSNSPDSSSTSSSNCKSHKMRLPSIQKSSCSSGSKSSQRSQSEKRHQRMKKMLMALREIVPGGDLMDAATVLDEAIGYLKSLKMEVKKLNIGNFKKN